ncbi:hypothetical protein JYU34_000944 [Plutella xylostella]|uniref:C-type lectin domain-containing protein n=1 Tax=Plutella xylostella TaxID=51655 RepID=A0ABQ7R5P5_PLUXY|nr:hypothetical protein JYU34_000944 [Plutella xylostella]
MIRAILFICRFIAIVAVVSGYILPKSCSDKYEQYVYKGREYILQNFPLRWEDARIMCRGHHNGTLAILDTEDKANYLAQALAESQYSDIDSVWVGARRSGPDDPHGYRWLDGGALRRLAADVVDGSALRKSAADVLGEKGGHYPLWQNRTLVPVPEGGADCAALGRVLHDTPVFLDLPCALERPFLCEREAKTLVPITDVRTVKCRAGRYHVYTARVTWDQAAAYCVMNRMQLANVDTMKCIRKLGHAMLKARPSIENAWVGARGAGGVWVWADAGTRVDAAPAQLDLDLHAPAPPAFLKTRCDRRMDFVCYDGKGSVPSGRREDVALPSDDNYYYRLVREPLTWQQAADNCAKFNGTLAVVDDNEILIELLLIMGENKESPISHIWLNGVQNLTKDVHGDPISYWQNPTNGKLIPDSKTHEHGLFVPPWLEDDYVTPAEGGCLNLDRQDHLVGLVYGLPCDTPQYSICMIEKAVKVTTKKQIEENKDAQLITSPIMDPIIPTIPTY